MSMTILPLIPGARCTQIEEQAETIGLIYVRETPMARCPGCGEPSSHVHSHYHRQVDEIPWARLPVRVFLTVRRFRCPTRSCAYQIFCERLDPWVPAYGRRSGNLTTWLADWGWHLSAEALVPLAIRQGIAISATTLLRILHAAPDPVWPEPQIVGIDDWALRKGQRYATVIVDLERHRIVDVLPDRHTETVAQWLARHPRITVVSRDRAQGYAKAITTGAPQAQQVADRWHLLKNLSETLERWFHRQPPAQAIPLVPEPPSSAMADVEPAVGGSVGLRHQQERYAQVHTLAESGHRVSEIARKTGLDRTTVRKYMQAPQPPTATSRAPARHLLDAFRPLLEQLWAEGKRKSPDVLAALQTAGYQGSRRTVTRWLRQRRQHAQSGTPSPTGPTRIAARTWMAWFLARWPHLPRSATPRLSQLLEQPTYRRGYALVHQFHTMLGHRHGQALPAWIRQAKGSAIPELARFAEGLESDYAAVQNGLTQEWSQGMTEGFNNQIKCLKRVMYGRAHFPLLRARILHNQS